MSKWTAAADANRGTLEFSIAQADVQKALKPAFDKNKNQIAVPGFRKGKVPMSLFMQKFGEEALYQDVMDIVLPAAYDAAVAEQGITVVGRPDIIPVSMDKGADWQMKAEVAVAPEIKLGDYTGLSVEKQDATVSDEEVDAEIKRQQENQAELVLQEDGTKAENGDTVVIDFDGSVDGDHFDGGQAKDYSLELGSGSFIPGFEDQLVGHVAGDDVDVKVTFPEEYQAKDLAGKEALFEVKLHEIKRKSLPDLDDEFAKDVDEDVDTLAELKEKTKKNLQEARDEAAKDAFEDAAVQAAVDNAEVVGGNLPEEMIHEDVDRQMQQYLAQLQQQGISPEMFFQISGQTQESFHKQFEEGADNRVKTNLVLEAIVKAEKIDPSADEVAAEVKSLADQYNISEEQVKQSLSDDLLKHDIAMKAVVDKIVSSAKAK
ncbi:trigger factor [Fructobacillus evanidus]|uniref:Trigger factor n=1 Tax=Fructobacillus evanidus TaxID=3064281 RepID=A0ABM9MNH3_9LACO|nr:FKBP-type peptidyl-prolyl cis-trans isomerase (trigger factor) (Tig) [Fructobacillus sp. LMG 32999]CAK1221723.1 FKBP-type peptidyl-prolyl cis-trans isomerase (trigger factor) (Tig) [Fructobacillus sp. LMG 32999]CAK1225725.1 FKBP-type peptidyl-prolyl cis-trans isomerase (trigger factor) (Tig) [Fructobacillus sp. LMG 32999]CAK1228475.1 FKBP-type peptidyl-prolyl cis-trans isomerase (trigger factor) (Tig) [Fructobacillus sp. LMG 32999]CAK1228678.1 FKBP-type peptidyl-prolyl cis-trans isomerase (t